MLKLQQCSVKITNYFHQQGYKVMKKEIDLFFVKLPYYPNLVLKSSISENASNDSHNFNLLFQPLIFLQAQITTYFVLKW